MVGSGKVFRHYVLFGLASREQWARLVLARKYLSRFQIPFGFSTEEAEKATRVTIVGDWRGVSREDESRLKHSGCIVERLLGDYYALEIILRERLDSEEEYG